jgi:hypothetical protein
VELTPATRMKEDGVPTEALGQTGDSGLAQ